MSFGVALDSRNVIIRRMFEVDGEELLGDSFWFLVSE